MKAYNEYKAWWLYYGEGSFEDHIDRMTLYELMEALSTWEDNQ